MKQFLQIFVLVLVLSEVFTFLGGIFLFDFSANPYGAMAICSFLLSLVLYGFVVQSDRIEALEERLAALVKTQNSPD